jgi:prephenate dehydrogenase
VKTIKKNAKKNIDKCTVGIAGLGLMGGAIAIALKKAAGVRPPGPRLFAHDSNGGILTRACSRGIIDQGFNDPGEMLARCDLVFLCLNPSAAIRFAGRWIGCFKYGALITDIAGTKETVAAAAEQLLRARADLDFIPGHPLAGAEKGGFAYAEKVSFTGKNYILTPLSQNRPENLAFLKEFIHHLGFGRVTETTASDHDQKIAFTSQLCHVIAAALVDCEADRKITRYGGGSFEDLTRIAMLNTPMWTELFLENRFLLSRIEQFEKSLDKIKTLIKNGRPAELEERLAAVRKQRIAMTGE